MRRFEQLEGWRLLRFLTVVLLAFFVSCAKNVRVETSFCPEPTIQEIEDFESLNPDRPVSIWVSRVVSYCWAVEAEGIE